MELLLLFLIILVLFVVFLILGIVKMVASKKRIIKILAIIPTIILFAFAYLIYDAVYPNESFYIDEWEINTDLPFPESADFEWKNATFPDQHNSYTSTAIIVVSEDDFDRLYKLAGSSETVIPDSEFNGFFTQFLPPDYKDEDLIDEYFHYLKKKSFKIGFGKDGQTIIFQRHNS